MTPTVQADVIAGVEVVQELLGGHPQRAQQHRGGELPAPIDADVQDVLRVELEVEPRPAIRNHAGIEQQSAASRRAPLVVIEENAGRTVELRHDDALGAVHHERAVLRHHRDLPEVDLLLLDVLERLGLRLGIDVVRDELDRHLQRRGERHASLVALLHVVLRLTDRVRNERELRRSAEVGDGKHRLEDPLQAHVGALLRLRIGLEERVVRAPLDLDQVGNVEHPPDFAEVTSQPEVLGNDGRHAYSCPVAVRGRIPRNGGRSAVGAT